MEVARSVESDR